MRRGRQVAEFVHGQADAEAIVAAASGLIGPAGAEAAARSAPASLGRPPLAEFAA
jgi:rhamnose transport system ATP-binding protein